MVEGEFEVNTQYHFYMETQTVLARPSEKGQIDMVSATQWSSSQHVFTNFPKYESTNVLFIFCFDFPKCSKLKTNKQQEICFLFQLRIIGEKKIADSYLENS